MNDTPQVVAEVIGLSGDKLVSAYTRHDALAFRDALLERGSANAIVNGTSNAFGLSGISPLESMVLERPINFQT